MCKDKGILFFHALTSMHPGSGTALGVVDLPIQRERHTQWPTNSGSAVKGVIRDAFRNKGDTNQWCAAFGPENITGDSDAYAGALSFTDARILAFPVRSLKGVFAWVTCPAVLTRFKRDLALLGKDTTFTIPNVPENYALASNQMTYAFGDQNKMILEEYEFDVQDDADAIAEVVAGYFAGDTAVRIKTHLVVLHDNDFTHFVRFATEVNARIGLDYVTKSVKDGALFYQEFLPPETLLYSLVFANKSHQQGSSDDAEQMFAYFKDKLPAALQFGGDETIGKGLTALYLA